MNGYMQTDGGERFYCSGDLGRLLPDGNFSFLRRKDEQVMILGKRVEPQEVENVIARCTNVKQVIVTAQVDEAELAYLTAHIIPDYQGLRVSGLRKELVEYLPDHMIPEYFIVLNQLPTTPSGKVDRQALPVVLKN